jgi:acyl carrier protein phosphodiesterase
MNFLAHAYLSGEKPSILAGNMIADFVKGKQALKVFDAEIVKGIELHRLIDEFTDSNKIVAESKARLRPKYRHYAGVIVDVFYDHFLAKNWSQYHSQPLEFFAAQVYKTMEAFYTISPGGFQYMFPYMVKGNWLLNYAKLEGIDRALTGMSRRTPYESKMDEAVHDLKDHYTLFKSEFEKFFPELKAMCDYWRNQQDQARA